MAPIETNLTSTISHDALRVWFDFWELTGRLRVDIVRTIGTGGNPEKMIPPDNETKEISMVPAVITGRSPKSAGNDPGEISIDEVKLELIDCVNPGDRIRLNGILHDVVSVMTRSLGDFDMWHVNLRCCE